MTDTTTNKTDMSLEERLARSLAGRLLGYTEKDADDIANVKDSLEDALRDAGVELCKSAKAGIYVTPNPAVVSDFLEEMFKGTPLGRVTEDHDEDYREENDEEDTAAELAELRHMRDVADAAYAALSDLALHCHNRRNETAWRQANEAADNAHRIANAIAEAVADLEDED
ncbi:hypothetical protein [Bifidobacterium simiiventris]|uniref:hypothetical protein n=1 Tax=Bifidobacterium simiiventris TaxID=2834434 RepID=UPI001C59E402|nr:hypothetical protein [Bifidobacterium simiiventris]MBW3077721.1 hypothetical protein [Bifidobacterium simiiventris]